ncbi:universal stress protein [Mesonia maritima]|uniref:Nucleotide-binding universal stress UspA family protein n=1 Tax=Mesonia maritima TaxID=1793873 RepID=A0ABU1K1K5_9FLAO|nr:universal stress protein [Mesonia maritima]MDR6299504.1 nucleotide-binding universal stress UspA family protein [Mesonia maritima]
MKKILLPTDFSDNAFNAIEYALQLFEKEECTFYLLNVYTPIVYDTEYIGYSSINPGLDEIYKNNSAVGLQKLEKKIKQTFSNKLHHFKQISSFNLLTDEINEQVENEHIDLIIMGTQGATGAKEVLFGSTTIRVIHRAKIPVLAIPSDYVFKGIQEILFPTDYEIDYNTSQLRWLNYLSTKENSALHVIHASEKDFLSSEQKKKKAQLEEKLESKNHKFKIVEGNNIPKLIYEYEKKNAIDLLAMVNNKHSFFENLFFKQVIDEIGFHTKVPFLVIPSQS